MFAKRIIIAWITVLLIFSAGCASKDIEYKVNNENYIILRLAESQPENYPSTQGDMEFARLVEEKSDGRIRVKIYDSGRLGEEESVIEQVHFGGIDLARVDLASLVQYAPEIGVLTLPYVIQDSPHMWTVIEGSLGEGIKDSLQKENILSLCWYEGGARNFYNACRDIHNVDDLAGLKMDIQYSQNVMDVYSNFGISLIPIGSKGVYSALEKGTIDGLDENIIRYYGSQLYDIANHIVLDAHLYIPEVIVASRTTMIQLPRSDQELIEEAAVESAEYQKQVWAEREREVMDALKTLDVSISDAGESLKHDFLAEAQPLYEILDPGYRTQLDR